MYHVLSKDLMVVFDFVSSIFIFVHSHINQTCMYFFIILFPGYGPIKRFKTIHTMSALIDLAFFWPK